MNLTKKQVKALLEVISKDKARPILTHAKIDTFDGQPVLVATDAYTLTAIKLSDDVLPIMGQLIPRAELIKWYKLAAPRDRLTEADLLTMATPDDNGYGEDKAQYPKWQTLIPADDDATEQLSTYINAAYMANMQLLADVKVLKWTFYGNMKPVIAKQDGNIYLVMPLKV